MFLTLFILVSFVLPAFSTFDRTRSFSGKPAGTRLFTDVFTHISPNVSSCYSIGEPSLDVAATAFFCDLVLYLNDIDFRT